jgi:hypothetical protein
MLRKQQQVGDAWRRPYGVIAPGTGLPPSLRLWRTSPQEEDVTGKPECDWRRQFGPGAVIQRVRPKESFANLANPHKGTTTFQRFNGDPLYEGNRWNDRVAPVEFGASRGRNAPPTVAGGKLLPNMRRAERRRGEGNAAFGGTANGPRYPETTIAYCRWIWSVMEPEKGRYRWDIIDGALETARARGQTLQVRMQPYAGDDLPQWFWELGGLRQKKPTEYKFREPDINHPLYIKHWTEFIRAFGRRYDGHPDLESFDIAYGGPWGEGGGNSNAETAKKIVDVYLRSFRRTQLVSMIGTHACAYAATRKNRRIGWRADCYGDVRMNAEGLVPSGQRWCHMYDAYPKEVALGGIAEAWRRGPVTLETCWTVGHWFEQEWDLDWIIEQGYKYHLSVFMPKSCYIPEEWMPKIEEFNRRMGYRFVLRQMILPIEVRAGRPAKVEVFLENVGCAPIYRRYRWAYRFRQNGREEVVCSRQDIREWMPGHTWFEERVAAPGWLRPGTAKVEVGIVGEASSGQEASSCPMRPRVRLAVEGVREDGWYPAAFVEVV